MKNWSFRRKFFVGVFVLFIALFVYRGYTKHSKSRAEESHSQNEILHLEIKGVIMNGKKFLANLKRYQKDKDIKAIVIDINSPGGAVGPSQEIYYEIMRAKKESKKPIVCVSTGLIASGGYYSALACDKIIVAPGTMIGSIGVIMEFANLEKLYDWAKVSRYTITSGKFKDSGSEYRAMRDDERQLFQDMIDDVFHQFRDAVATSRNLSKEFVDKYADGRVMTGSKAVSLKFADAEGTFEDAVRMAANMAQLGDDYKLFKPHREKMDWMDFLTFNDDEEDDLNSLTHVAAEMKSVITGQKSSAVNQLADLFLKTKSLNQPMYMMPGYWQ